MSGDLVLELSEETSLLLSLDSSFIDNPFLIFEELSVLNEGLMNIGLSVSSSGSVGGNSTTESGVETNITSVGG